MKKYDIRWLANADLRSNEVQSMEEIKDILPFAALLQTYANISSIAILSTSDGLKEYEMLDGEMVEFFEDVRQCADVIRGSFGDNPMEALNDEAHSSLFDELLNLYDSMYGLKCRSNDWRDALLSMANLVQFNMDRMVKAAVDNSTLRDWIREIDPQIPLNLDIIQTFHTLASESCLVLLGDVEGDAPREISLHDFFEDVTGLEGCRSILDMMVPEHHRDEVLELWGFMLGDGGISDTDGGFPDGGEDSIDDGNGGSYRILD